MPPWAQYVIGVAALVTALGIIWRKVVQPGIKAASTADEMLPLLRELLVVFRDDPTAFKVLNSIAKEFRTDSGSTMRDLMERQEKSINSLTETARIAAVSMEAQSRLIERDRLQLDQVRRLVDTVLAQRAVVAADLVVDRASDAADRAVIADDLATSPPPVDSKDPST